MLLSKVTLGPQWEDVHPARVLLGLNIAAIYKDLVQRGPPLYGCSESKGFSEREMLSCIPGINIHSKLTISLVFIIYIYLMYPQMKKT